MPAETLELEAINYPSVPKLGPDDKPVFLDGIRLDLAGFMAAEFGTDRVELIEGRVYVAPSPNRDHQDTTSFFMMDVFAKLEKSKRGKFLAAPCDFIVDDETVVQPDLLWLPPDHPALNSRDVLRGTPPGLVIEILSPTSKGHDRIRKRELYAKAGVPYFWIADPMAKTIEGFELRNGAYQPCGATKDGIFAALPFEGLAIAIKEIFPWE
ncbi:MAG: Uma2 family endonuclease [Planctomycetes bacterium]|nr:Uma2 family endonuclease [Planctomycetota bacterium]